MLKKLILALSLCGLILIPQTAMAVDVFTPICEQAEFNSGQKPVVCSEKDRDQGIFGPGGIVDKVVTILSFVVGIASIFVLIIFGGLRMMTSGGEPNAISAARRTIIFSAAGLGIAVAARVLVEFIISRVSN
jgi:hypothetical protein